MITAYLIRYERKNTHNLGVLVYDQDVFYTIERPWKRNQRNVSCIPTGKYLVNYLPRSSSGKYRKCYHLSQVPQRSGVLIHQGNLVSHSRGCIIIGSRSGVLGGLPAVLASKPALRKLNAATGTNPYILEIIE